jgi:hypothetical protein
VVLSIYEKYVGLLTSAEEGMELPPVVSAAVLLPKPLPVPVPGLR